MLRLPTSPSYREGNEKNLLNIARTGWKDAYPYLCIHLFNCGQYSPLDSLKQVGMFNILWIIQSPPEIGPNYTVYYSVNGNFVFWNSLQLYVPLNSFLRFWECTKCLQNYSVLNKHGEKGHRILVFLVWLCLSYPNVYKYSYMLTSKIKFYAQSFFTLSLWWLTFYLKLIYNCIF